MIIECVKCNKKFEVDSKLIPPNGRTLQCSSCNHVWFFKNEELNTKNKVIAKEHKEKEYIVKNDANDADKNNISINEQLIASKKHSYKKHKNKTNRFSLDKFFSILVVIIITFVALIIIIDTFKTPLIDAFPPSELLIFNLFESLKDFILFVKDLIS